MFISLFIFIFLLCFDTSKVESEELGVLGLTVLVEGGDDDVVHGVGVEVGEGVPAVVCQGVWGGHLITGHYLPLPTIILRLGLKLK